VSVKYAFVQLKIRFRPTNTTYGLPVRFFLWQTKKVQPSQKACMRRPPSSLCVQLPGSSTPTDWNKDRRRSWDGPRLRLHVQTAGKLRKRTGATLGATLAGARCAVSSGLLPRPGAGAGTGAISGERNCREDLLRQGHTIECIHCGEVESTHC
jgi:hypothetical protein